MSEYSKIKDNLIEADKQKNRRDGIIIVILVVLIGILLSFWLLNTFVFLTVRVEGDSMRDTLYSGEVLLGNRTATPNRGDIILIEGVIDKDLLIKRLIAKGGDTVDITDGKVYVNGEELNEPYAKGVTKQLGYRDFPFVVAEGYYFYLGDNRENSSDARYFGDCKASQVIGVVGEWELNNKWLGRIIYTIITLPSEWINGLFGCQRR